MARLCSFMICMTMVMVVISNPQLLTTLAISLKTFIEAPDEAEDKKAKEVEPKDDPTPDILDETDRHLLPRLDPRDLIEPMLYIGAGVLVLVWIGTGLIALAEGADKRRKLAEENRTRGLVAAALANRLEYGELLQLQADLARIEDSEEVIKRRTEVAQLLEEARRQEEAKILRAADLTLDEVRPKITEEGQIVEEGREELGTDV